MPESHRSQDRQTPEPLATPEAGFFRKNMGWFIGGTAVLAVAGIAWGANELTSSNEPAKAPEPTEHTAGLPGQSFQSLLTQTQETKRKMPEVLTNFQLSNLLSGDFPQGTNTAELVTIKAGSCVTASGASVPGGSVSRIVFRNKGGDTGPYKSAYLTDDHIKDAESYRTAFREAEVENGYVKPTSDDFSGKAKNQIYGQVADNLCGTIGARLVAPTIASQQVIISGQEMDGGNAYDAPGNNAALIGIIVVGGLIAGGIKLYKDRQKS